MKTISPHLKSCFSHRHAQFAYSLLEVIVAFTIFGTVLMMAATSLLEALAHQRELQQYGNANRLAQNLMETLLALPAQEAQELLKNLETKGNSPVYKIWSDAGHYKIKGEWQPDPSNTHLVQIFLEYDYGNHPIIQLSTIRKID